jgi:urease accessory protein
MRFVNIFTGVAVLALAASPAFAHPGHTDPNGLWHGFIHPFTGWDHLVAMAALGLWLGGTKSTGLVQSFIAFAGALLAGFLLGVNGYHIPFVEAGILASVFVFALLAITLRKLPALLAAPLIAVFMLCHGQAHGAEVTGSALLFGAGFVAASLLIAGATYGLMRFRMAQRRAASQS